MKFTLYPKFRRRAKSAAGATPLTHHDYDAILPTGLFVLGDMGSRFPVFKHPSGPLEPTVAPQDPEVPLTQHSEQRDRTGGNRRLPNYDRPFVASLSEARNLNGLGTSPSPEFYVNHHLAHEDEAQVDLVSFSTTTLLSRTASFTKRPLIPPVPVPDPEQKPSDAQSHHHTQNIHKSTSQLRKAKSSSILNDSRAERRPSTIRRSVTITTPHAPSRKQARKPQPRPSPIMSTDDEASSRFASLRSTRSLHHGNPSRRPTFSSKLTELPPPSPSTFSSTPLLSPQPRYPSNLPREAPSSRSATLEPDSENIDATAELPLPATKIPKKAILSPTRPRRLRGARSEAQLRRPRPPSENDSTLSERPLAVSMWTNLKALEKTNSGRAKIPMSDRSLNESSKPRGDALQPSFARRSVLEELDHAVQSLPQVAQIRTQARAQAHQNIFARARPTPTPAPTSLNLDRAYTTRHVPQPSSRAARPLDVKPAAHASRRHGLSMPKKTPSSSPPKSRSKRSGQILVPSPASSPLSSPVESATTADNIAEAIALAMLRGCDSGSSGDESDCTQMADDEAKGRRDKALNKEKARAREKASEVASRRKSAMLGPMPLLSQTTTTTGLALRARSASVNVGWSKGGKAPTRWERDDARVPRLLRV